MFLTCALLIANLCVPRDYVAVSHLSAMYVEVDASGKPVPSPFDPDLSRRTRTEILAWDGDALQTVVSAGMNRVCDHGWCVYYRKHCSDGGRRCQYALSDAVAVAAGDTKTRAVVLHRGAQIRAPSRGAMRQIDARLRLVLHQGNDGTNFAVPLTRMDHESPDITSVTNCMASVWVEGCGRPEHPQSPRPRHL